MSTNNMVLNVYLINFDFSLHKNNINPIKFFNVFKMFNKHFLMCRLRFGVKRVQIHTESHLNKAL